MNSPERSRAVHVGLANEGIGLHHRGASEWQQRFENAIQLLGRKCRNPKNEFGEIVVGTPDLELLHLECAFVRDHCIEDRIQ